MHVEETTYTLWLCFITTQACLRGLPYASEQNRSLPKMVSHGLTTFPQAPPHSLHLHTATQGPSLQLVNFGGTQSNHIPAVAFISSHHSPVCVPLPLYRWEAEVTLGRGRATSSFMTGSQQAHRRRPSASECVASVLLLSGATLPGSDPSSTTYSQSRLFTSLHLFFSPVK